MNKKKMLSQEKIDGTYTFFAEGGKWKIGEVFTYDDTNFQIITIPFGGRVTMDGKWTYVFHFEAKKI